MKVTTLRYLSWLAFVVAAVAVTLLLVAGPGHRFELWHYRVSFGLMRWGAYAGIAAAVLAVTVATLLLRKRQRVFWCLATVVFGTVAAFVPWQQLRAARSVPPIHDITTDTEHPPEFVAVRARRAPTDHRLEYGGADLAAQQHAAYPDIGPLMLDAPRDRAFGRALAAAHALGWDVVDADAEAGRIEATDTTFWFGFKDDVVIRVTPDGDRIRVDVRSGSRVGKSDVGANARRIRRYLETLQGG